MKKILIISALVLVGFFLVLMYWGNQRKISQVNLLLEGSDYQFVSLKRIENSKAGFSFEKPSNWYLEHEDNSLYLYSSEENFPIDEDICPEIKNACSILVQVKDNQAEAKKLISDIEYALEADDREEIINGIKEVYEFIEFSDKTGVKQFIFREELFGSLYYLSIPTEERNYFFEFVVKPECEQTLEHFLQSIKID